MWRLGIDTSGASGLVALGNGSDLESVEVAGRTFSAGLIPAADGLLRAAGIRLEDVGLIAVVSGPGSFTGIRIGLSVAKAWVEVTGVNLVAISRLAWCAASLQPEQVRVAVDAGRGELFFGEYAEHGFRQVREALIRPGDMDASAQAPLFAFDEKAAELMAGLGAVLARAPRGEQLLQLAGRYAAAGRYADALTLDANYLRRSDAELFARVPGNS